MSGETLVLFLVVCTICFSSSLWPGDFFFSINVDKDYPGRELRLAQCVRLTPVMNSYCVEILGMTVIGKLI